MPKELMLTAPAIEIFLDKLRDFYMEMAEAVEMLSAKLAQESVETTYAL